MGLLIIYKHYSIKKALNPTVQGLAGFRPNATPIIKLLFQNLTKNHFGYILIIGNLNKGQITSYNY